MQSMQEQILRFVEPSVPSLAKNDFSDLPLQPFLDLI